jgi:hypothetical protein
MFCREIKLNQKLLANQITATKQQLDKQEKLLSVITAKQPSIEINQTLLFELIKKLADCHQLEYSNGKYVTKRGRKNKSMNCK